MIVIEGVDLIWAIYLLCRKHISAYALVSGELSVNEVTSEAIALEMDAHGGTVIPYHLYRNQICEYQPQFCQNSIFSNMEATE